MYQFVDCIGTLHDMAYGSSKITRLVCRFDDTWLPVGKMLIHQLLQQLIIFTFHQPAAKPFTDKPGAAAGNINVFTDQICINTRNKIFQIKVDIFHAAIELGGIVITQPFRIQPLLQITFRRNEGTARLTHLFTIHGQKTMGKNLRGRTVTRILQHGRPEQGMKIKNILANKMIKLRIRAFFPVAVKINSPFAAKLPEAAHITNGCIQPDVEILATLTGNFKAEIRCIA